MTKQELINFIEAFYDNKLPYCVVYSEYDVHYVGETEKVLAKNKINMRLLTYGGIGSDKDAWCVSIHEYMDGRTVTIGNIEFFGNEYTAKDFAQDRVNTIANENGYIATSTLDRWVSIGLTVPEIVVKKMNERFIEREEQLERDLAAMRSERAEFFKKYC